MSHYCEDEYYTVYDETCRRARKNHVCHACKETIPRGHVYHVINIVFDGSAETVKRCLRCQEIHEHLRALAPGEMWPAERLDCGEEYEAHWGREPPDEIAILAFLTPEEMQARLAKLVAEKAAEKAMLAVAVKKAP